LYFEKMNSSAMTKAILILLLFSQNLLAQQQYDFAIYHDGNIGAWEDGVVAFEHFLDWKGLTHNRVTAEDINSIVLKNYYSAIFFPGGDADYYNADIDAFGIQHIQELVAENGAYIGMCAGAEFACDQLVWEGIAYDYPLDLFQGEAVGPIDELAVWPDYAMATLSMNLNDELNQYEPANEDILYWGGSIFNAYEGTEVDTIATFDGYLDEAAIIKLNYGEGRVLLISPHPEIEEDSERDGVNIASELSDNGSDWNFLWTATDWLLGNPLTDSSSVFVPEIKNKKVRLYPNPAKDFVNVQIDDLQEKKTVFIFNQLGKIVKQLSLKDSSIDISDLPRGIYILKIESRDINIRKKLIIQ